MQLRKYQIEAIKAISQKSVEGVKKQILVLATGLGKAQPLRAKVLTPDGFCEIGNINIGDSVIGSDGMPKRVTGKFPQGIKDIYEVEFSDGAKTWCCNEHLWAVQTKYDKHDDRGYRIKELREINDSLIDTAGRPRWEIPITEPVFYPNKELPFDPYVLGVLIADGGLTQDTKRVTISDDGVLTEFSKRLPGYITLNYSINFDYKLNVGRVGCKGSELSANLEMLELNCYSYDKHIPKIYLEAPIKDRVLLLGALMDSDGCAESGCAIYYTTSARLRDDVVALVRSLGGTPVWHTKKNPFYRDADGNKVICRDCYCVVVNLGDINPFLYSKKKNIYHDRRPIVKYYPRRAIAKITKIGREEAVCISVDSKDHLYVTDDFILTHNTVVFGHLPSMVKHSRGLKTLIIAHRDELLQQAKEKIHAIDPDLSIEIEMADQHADPDADVVIASVATIGRENSSRIEKFDPLSYGLIIVDECHHAAAASYINVFKHFGVWKNKDKDDEQYVEDQYHNPDTLLLGVTATAFRGDGTGLDKVFDEVVYNYGLKEGIRDGYLARIKAYAISTTTDISGVHTKMGDFMQNELAEQINNPARNKLVAKTYNELLTDKRALVFAIDVDHCYALQQSFKDEGVDAEVVVGTTDPDLRRSYITQLKSGYTKVLINCQVLCLDLDTEILTLNGWKQHDTISPDDLVANFKMETSEIFFYKPEEIVKRKLYEFENMVSVVTDKTNIRVTGTHRMITFDNYKKEFFKSPAEELIGKRFWYPVSGNAEPIKFEEDKIVINKRLFMNSTKHYLKKLYGYNNESAIVEAERRYERKISLTTKTPDKLTIDECKLIGFWIGDGSVSKLIRGGVEYTLCQSKTYPHIVEWIDALLNGIGIDHIRREKKATQGNANDFYVWSLPRGTGSGIQEREGVIRIEKYLNKNGTELFWGLNREQLSALLEGLWMADGNHGDGKSFRSRTLWISNSNHQLLSLLQSIATCRGISSTLSKGKIPLKTNHNQVYNLTFNLNKKIRGVTSTDTNNRIQINNRSADEEVWCVKTITKNIVTRRNGRVCIMGNTEGFDCPAVEGVMLARPTKSSVLYQQMIGRGTRLSPDTGKEYCSVVDFVDNLGKNQIVTMPDLMGIPKTKLNGEDVLDVYDKAQKIAEAGAAVPTDWSDASIEKSIQEVDIFKQCEIPSEIREYSKYAWSYCIGGYRIVGPADKEYPGTDKDYVEITRDMLDNWTVKTGKMHFIPSKIHAKYNKWVAEPSFGDRVFSDTAKAFAYADEQVPVSIRRMIDQNAKWRSGDASEKQLQLLRKLGTIVPAEGLSKGQASQLIDTLLSKKNK